jgi:hypothetical protein
MHVLDLGLYNYQLEFTFQLLRSFEGGNSLIDEINIRLSKIPRYNNLKIFNNGITALTRMTANDYRNLMKVFVFVLDNLYSSKNFHDEENKIKNEMLTRVFVLFNKMYIKSRKESFTESDLIDFEVKENFY